VMCTTCGCTPLEDELSKVERVKAGSNHLRGTLAEDLTQDTPTFNEENVQLLKFHGVYQQEDRDKRKEARRLGPEKHHQMMIRTRIPGGVVRAEADLPHDHGPEPRRRGAARRSRCTASSTCPASSRRPSAWRATTASTSTPTTWAWSRIATDPEPSVASTCWLVAASVAHATSRRRSPPWPCPWRRCARI